MNSITQTNFSGPPITGKNRFFNDDIEDPQLENQQKRYLEESKKKFSLEEQNTMLADELIEDKDIQFLKGIPIGEEYEQWVRAISNNNKQNKASKRVVNQKAQEEAREFINGSMHNLNRNFKQLKACKQQMIDEAQQFEYLKREGLNDNFTILNENHFLKIVYHLQSRQELTFSQIYQIPIKSDTVRQLTLSPDNRIVHKEDSSMIGMGKRLWDLMQKFKKVQSDYCNLGEHYLVGPQRLQQEVKEYSKRKQQLKRHVKIQQKQEETQEQNLHQTIEKLFNLYKKDHNTLFDIFEQLKNPQINEQPGQSKVTKKEPQAITYLQKELVKIKEDHIDCISYLDVYIKEDHIDRISYLDVYSCVSRLISKYIQEELKPIQERENKENCKRNDKDIIKRVKFYTSKLNCLQTEILQVYEFYCRYEQKVRGVKFKYLVLREGSRLNWRKQIQRELERLYQIKVNIYFLKQVVGMQRHLQKLEMQISTQREMIRQQQFNLEKVCRLCNMQSQNLLKFIKTTFHQEEGAFKGNQSTSEHNEEYKILLLQAQQCVNHHYGFKGIVNDPYFLQKVEEQQNCDPKFYTDNTSICQEKSFKRRLLDNIKPLSKLPIFKQKKYFKFQREMIPIIWRKHFMTNNQDGLKLTVYQMNKVLKVINKSIYRYHSFFINVCRYKHNKRFLEAIYQPFEGTYLDIRGYQSLQHYDFNDKLSQHFGNTELDWAQQNKLKAHMINVLKQKDDKNEEEICSPRIHFAISNGQWSTLKYQIAIESKQERHKLKHRDDSSRENFPDQNQNCISFIYQVILKPMTLTSLYKESRLNTLLFYKGSDSLWYLPLCKIYNAEKSYQGYLLEGTDHIIMVEEIITLYEQCLKNKKNLVLYFGEQYYDLRSLYKEAFEKFQVIFSNDLKKFKVFMILSFIDINYINQFMGLNQVDSPPFNKVRTMLLINNFAHEINMRPIESKLQEIDKELDTQMKAMDWIEQQQS